MEKETIFENLKSNMPDSYEKETPGFLTYDILKSAAVALKALYDYTDVTASKLDPSKLTGDELTRECYYRRGIARKAATKAIVVLTVTGTGTVTIGDLFSTVDNLQFSATETKAISGTGTINAQCTTAGTIGNVGAGLIIQFPVTIPGITAVTNNSASYDGFEEETDVSLWERYQDDIQNPITSNNIYHFQKWATEIAGVGKAKIFPTWNGNNSVKVVIINALMLPSSSELVSAVQEYIDPIDPATWGKGYGTAAIGSYCTVTSATGKSCNVTAVITKSDNFTLETIIASVRTAITAYFQDIAFHETINYISYAKIAALIVNVEGVLDVSSVLLNGSASNIMLGAEEVPVLGTVGIS